MDELEMLPIWVKNMVNQHVRHTLALAGTLIREVVKPVTFDWASAARRQTAGRCAGGACCPNP